MNPGEVSFVATDMATLRRKLQAFRELFGDPSKISMSPERSPFVALLGGDDVFGAVDVFVIQGRSPKLQVLVDGRMEWINVNWSSNTNGVHFKVTT